MKTLLEAYKELQYETDLNPMLEVWMKHLGNTPLAHITSLAVEQALHFIEHHPPVNATRTKNQIKKLSKGSRNNYLICISAFLTLCHKRRWLPLEWTNPCSIIDLYRLDNQRTVAFTKAQYDQLIAECKRKEYHPMLWLFVALGYSTGLRKTNILHLRWGDIDLENGTCYVDRTKNGSAFATGLHSKIIEALTPLVGKPSDYIFESERTGKPFEFKHQYRQALQRCGLHGNAHTLRHSFATTLAKSGASQFQISDALNHKSISSSKRYVHMITKDRKTLIESISL